jgi:methylphosphotriester-DNA--protein-cysteine methyltransferase
MKNNIKFLSIIVVLLFSISLLAQEKGKLVGSTQSKKFHNADCPAAKKIAKENLIEFASVAEAKAKGYEACKTCKPGEMKEVKKAKKELKETKKDALKDIKETKKNLSDAKKEALKDVKEAKKNLSDAKKDALKDVKETKKDIKEGVEKIKK